MNEEEERAKAHLLEELITVIQTDAEGKISLQCPVMPRLKTYNICMNASHVWGYGEELGFISYLDVGRWVASELLSGQNDLVLRKRAEVTMIQESHLGQTGRKLL